MADDVHYLSKVGHERGKLHQMMQGAVEANTSTPEAIANSFAKIACDQLRLVLNSFVLSNQSIARLRSAQFRQNSTGGHTGLARSRWIMSGPTLSRSAWARLLVSDSALQKGQFWIPNITLTYDLGCSEGSFLDPKFSTRGQRIDSRN